MVEETGATNWVDGSSASSNPRDVVAFSDGEVLHEFSVCFRVVPAHRGTRRPGRESTVVDWGLRDQVAGLTVHLSIRMHVTHRYAGRETCRS